MLLCAGLAWLLAPAGSARADGIYRDGAGARAMALGGSSTGLPDAPLEALHSNPAGLSLLESTELQLGGVAGRARGEFRNAANTSGRIRDGDGLAPEFALGYRLPSAPVALGIGLVPDGVLGASWRYVDAPGGLGGAASYGLQKHRSEIAVVRSVLAASVTLRERLSLGAGLGLIYNRNTLQAPYIFQSHPVLSDFKTLLKLRTEGWGWNGLVGAHYAPHDKVSLGLSYRTETRVDSEGNASGNAAAQLQALGGAFAGVRPDFHYDASVVNTFPQVVSGGLSWQASPRARLVFQLDWVNWSDAFDDLEVKLSDGNNADLNGFLGTDRIRDSIPLRWRDSVVGRAGAEFQLSESFTVRGGYSYGRNPVPHSTLSPLTAAIMEHTLGAGLGWEQGRYRVDLAYQHDFSATGRVGASALRAGEYSAARTEVEAHWIGLTTSVRF